LIQQDKSIRLGRKYTVLCCTVVWKRNTSHSDKEKALEKRCQVDRSSQQRRDHLHEKDHPDKRNPEGKGSIEMPGID